MNKKTVVILLFITIFLGVTVGSMLFLRVKNKSNNLQTNYRPNYQEPKEKTLLVKEKEKQPNTITGIVQSVDKDKLVIKQFASFDLRYEVKKEDIGSVVLLKENPSFDEEKAAQYQEELFKKMEERMKNPQEASKEKPIEEPTEIDSSLQEYIEEDISWKNVETGSSVNIFTEDSAKKLVVYPEGYDIGPPK